ncbi:MAG: pyruvate dehydrogenase complex dihydrolipoamide acetyltransferase [Parvibaculaceae bacterium]|nr:pyruvate dehydrogenase complex dihydrolipoamide acetyltransferase [Parvibaculaceae bacterium]
MPIKILMPALSPTMEEGTLAKWLVKEGDEVHAGDIIAEIETDKATMEYEAADEGRIGKILVQEGAENVRINTPIALLLEEGEDVSTLKDAAAAPASKAPEAKAPEAKPAQAAPAPAPAKIGAPKPEGTPKPEVNGHEGARLFASPLARRIAADKGVDLSSLTGTGPRGRVVKADVEKALKEGVPQKAAAPASTGAAAPGPAIDPRKFYEDGSYEEVPLDNMRRTIARRLAQAMQEIPHYYLTIDCEIDEVLKARKVLNERAPEGVKLSVNDFIIRASALALKQVPDANVSFAGTALLKHKHADIGIAVALEGGLITPIVKAAETKGLAQISSEVKDLAERAKAKKLKPTEYEGGSFSISNLGMFGIKEFTAVINPPQAAILAVGKGEERAVVRGGKLEVANVMTVTLSCDHRAIDGALGARLLEAFRGYIEYPASMLL